MVDPVQRLSQWGEISQLFGRDKEHDMICPLVNVATQLWKDPPFVMGKFTILTRPFSIAKC